MEPGTASAGLECGGPLRPVGIVICWRARLCSPRVGLGNILASFHRLAPTPGAEQYAQLPTAASSAAASQLTIVCGCRVLVPLLLRAASAGGCKRCCCNCCCVVAGGCSHCMFATTSETAVPVYCCLCCRVPLLGRGGRDASPPQLPAWKPAPPESPPPAPAQQPPARRLPAASQPRARFSRPHPVATQTQAPAHRCSACGWAADGHCRHKCTVLVTVWEAVARALKQLETDECSQEQCWLQHKAANIPPGLSGPYRDERLRRCTADESAPAPSAAAALPFGASAGSRLRFCRGCSSETTATSASLSLQMTCATVLLLLP